jgi:hypothetical protein
MALEHHAARYGRDARERLDDLDERAHEGAGILAGAAHQAVRQAVLDHHRGKIIRVEQNLPRIAGADVPVALKPLEALGQDRQVVRLGGIDDADPRRGRCRIARPCARFPRYPQQDRRAQLHPVEPSGRLENARLRALRKDNPLGVALQLLENGLDESHSRILGSSVSLHTQA